MSNSKNIGEWFFEQNALHSTYEGNSLYQYVLTGTGRKMSKQLTANQILK